MADDAQSSTMSRRRPGRRPKRGPLVVMNNVGNDLDDDSDRMSTVSNPQYHYDPPPLPSLPPQSPSSEYPYAPATSSYTPRNPTALTTLATDVSDKSRYDAARSNPSLSSPSGSSSPAIESTPPPSTPGQTAPPGTLLSDASESTEKPGTSSVEDRSDPPNHGQGIRSSPMDRFIYLSSLPNQRRLSNQHMQRPATSPTVATGQFTSPVSSRDSPKEKVLLTVTADCDIYTYLDITGVKDSAIVREKIFSKLQISDEEQPHFSIYRTEIGSFASGDALDDEHLMDIIEREGDAKGSLKFLVQHSSATVHTPPQPRTLAANHVPPVLPYHETFRSPNQTLSPRSNHDSRSSVSEPVPPEGLSAGYEASVSDDFEHFERERQRNTIRPPQPPAIQPGSYSNVPGSPADRRRRNGSLPRAPSPSSSPRRRASPPRPLSPIRTSPFPSVPSLHMGRGGSSSSTLSLTQSPLSPQFDENSVNSSSRVAHGRNASETATTDKQSQHRGWGLRPRGDKSRQDSSNRKASAGESSDSLGKRTQEPWVVIPHLKERPGQIDTGRSQSGLTRPNGQQTQPMLYPADNGRYPAVAHQSSRNHLAPLPISARPNVQAVPTGSAARGYQQGQPVHPQWPIKFLGNRLHNAKSVDSLHAQLGGQPTSLTPGMGPRKPNPLPMAKPSVMGLRDTAINTGSYVQVESPQSRRDGNGLNSAGLARSYDSRNANISPTAYASRSTAPNPMLAEPLPNASTQYRQLPIHGQNSTTGSGYSTTTSASTQGQGLLRVNDDTFPRATSAFDDIGASPIPVRQYRPLPPSGPWQEPESSTENNEVRSPNANNAVPSNPRYGLANPWNQVSRPPISSPSHANSVFGDSYADAHADSSQNTPRPPRALPSPESERRPSLDQREKSQQAQGSSETIKPPRQLVPFSPVDDRESDGTGDTLKPAEHGWLLGVLDSHSSDATIIPEQTMKSKPPSEYAPTPPPKDDIHGKSSNTQSSDIWNGGDNDYDSEGDDDDDSGTLWQTPPSKQSLKRKSLGRRPQLSVDTEGNSRLSPVAMPSSRSSPYNTPPTYPPPSFPPPPPPPLAHVNTRRGMVQSAKNRRDNAPKRDSQFEKSRTYTWAFRPPAEDVYERLEEFFPDHDLDKPVIEATSGGTSPTTAEPVAPLPAAPAAQQQQRSKHKKSIRLVAAEHKRKIDRTSRSDSSSMSSILRKRSTKLWGSKVEEVTSKNMASAIPESPSAPSQPKPIFKWVRGELIGRGTYGRVYLALNATTGEMIAVKQVEIPRTDSDRDDSRQITVVEALKLESETLKDLDHPNIVQYLGFEQTPDFLSIFLEYVPGGSVAGCLRKHGKFDDQVARSFTGQVLEGLEYLHANGIIHRDLKADNLLVDPSGIIKISDFGISKRTDDINVNGIHTGMQGSVFWMAPEVISAGRAGPQIGYNGKVDIWSLGCVVLEMWAGRRPWPDADAIAVLVQLVKNQCAPPVPEDVILSPVADDFRSKCFAIKPEDRPSASELRKHPYLVLQPGWTFNGFK
ncbi:Pkinase-domain-containing protein [Rickenella mellea]|uniref:Pkinase-domain-containing protein n=1 Tax=Rickenella mellea TaxID=50990 RepID=A0A4Y7QN81_9AGAM|nr:Pkinase-domain-containing protein [Rickenella mellea]